MPSNVWLSGFDQIGSVRTAVSVAASRTLQKRTFADFAVQLGAAIRATGALVGGVSHTLDPADDA